MTWADAHPPHSVPGLFYPSVAYDAFDGYVVLFGGCGGVICSTPSNQTWTWTNGSWALLSTGPAPPGREEAMMTYDATAGVVLLYGGRGSAGVLSDTWAFRGGVWEQLSPVASPGPRDYGNLVYDAADAESVLFGGYACYSGCGTWVFAHDNWTELNISMPPWRYAAGSAYSTSLGEVVLSGGVGNGGGDYADTWTFSGGAWNSVISAGPPLRSDPEMAYDGALGQVLLFGGTYVTLSNFPGVAYDDTWTYSASGWTQLSPSASPPSLSEGALSFDGASSYAVEVGGCGPAACPSGESWVAGPTAHVTVTTVPSSCGSVVLAGTSRTEGASATLPQGGYWAAPVPCAHYGFSNMTGSGGVAAAPDGGGVSVSSDGTLTVRFSPSTYYVTLSSSPATCGSFMVDGLAAPAGESLPFVFGLHNFSTTGCDGMTFTGWNATDANFTFPNGVGDPAQVEVLGNGSVQAQFAPSGSSVSAMTIAGIPLVYLIIVVLAVAAGAVAAVLLKRRGQRPPPHEEPPNVESGTAPSEPGAL